ncbi:hypothetical protein [Sphingomonas xinjiangensis]|uniref:Uncharacterized protein n=1 Tax=Sphingomonas xinjiangensis TaxID=643568 RepID=A0A840Y8C6_9SPHN|nr:hypothetical protein [Sphingomonas xinjiangensis]MBB5709567.1 hypothetical protein [Sphingomonas xinjiangensis]
MSKQPPVPMGNQSPYPVEEAPHDHKGEGEAVKAAREAAEARKRRTASSRQLGIGAAVGVGSAAVVAGLMYWRGNRKDSKDKK